METVALMEVPPLAVAGVALKKLNVNWTMMYVISVCMHFQDRSFTHVLVIVQDINTVVLGGRALESRDLVGGSGRESTGSSRERDK